jgi:AmiR/NasT family two-component response regulator
MSWWFVEKIRVLIALETRFARDLVRSIVSQQADFEVIGEVRDTLEILPAIEQTKPDSLIITQQESDRRPVICDLVFQKAPLTRILALTSGSEESTLYWLTTEIQSARIETWEGVLESLRNKVGT